MKVNVNSHNVDYIKRLAKKIKKEKGLTHHEALNLSVQKLGFKNWKHFYNKNKSNESFKELPVIPIDELNGLSHNGFSNEQEIFDPKVFSNKNKLKDLRIEIRKYFKKIKTFNKYRGSYGLKHNLERHIEEYVTNGELIYAMYLEGYEIKRNGINCYFNMSTVGLKNLIISNKLLETLRTSWQYELDDYLHLKKKFLKYKYHFNLIIRLLLQNDFSNKNIYGVIGAEIGETSETIKHWFNMECKDSATIPEKKLEMLSVIFGFKPEKLKNNKN